MSRTFVQVKHMRSKFELFWDTVGLPIYYILVYYSSTAICIIQDMGEIKKKAVRQVRLVVNGQLVGQVRLGYTFRSSQRLVIEMKVVKDGKIVGRPKIHRVDWFGSVVVNIDFECQVRLGYALRLSQRLVVGMKILHSETI